jgi:phage terminase large subunit-like protein
VKRGPKQAGSLEPLDDHRLPKAGPDRVIKWVHRYCIVPHGKGAKKPMRLRHWQQAIVRELYRTPRARAGLVSLPRGNGKSLLAAALALYELLGTDVESPQVLCVASDERQAGIVFNTARRMIELHDDLAARCVIYKDHVRVPRTDGEMRPLPSQAAALEGYRPTFAVVDELAVVTRDVWETMTLAAGKSRQSMVLAISTPAGDREGVMWALVEHGRKADDPGFRFVEHAAPSDCALDDEQAWKIANPALGDFLHIDALRANLKTTRPAAFRRYRLGQWVGQEGAWLSWDAWQRCQHLGDVAPFTPIVLAFDGSASGDSTYLLGATISERPHLFTIGCWANPGDARWRVPRREVLETIRQAFEKYDVRELAADPWGWRTELEELSDEQPGKVIELPTNNVARMAPLTDMLYSAVHGEPPRVTHDGSGTLAAHIANAVAKSTSAGDVLVKDARNSPRKIDGAICAVLGHGRALWHHTNTNTYTPNGVVFL